MLMAEAALPRGPTAKIDEHAAQFRPNYIGLFMQAHTILLRRSCAVFVKEDFEQNHVMTGVGNRG